jgi:ATP adenylyltransferase
MPPRRTSTDARSPRRHHTAVATLEPVATGPAFRVRSFGMDIQRLWAPWRLGYVQGADRGDPRCEVAPRQWRTGADRGCFLCRASAVEATHDRTFGVLERTAQAIVLLNRFPYTNGHLLVAPLEHLARLDELPSETLLALQERIVRWCGLIEKSLEAEGFNVGLNLGAVAGAGVPGHLHWHVVPRWPGDVNFMPTVAGARVLPQALDALWEQLTGALGDVSTESRP